LPRDEELIGGEPWKLSMELLDHSKPLIEDKEFTADVRVENLTQKALRRVFAVSKTFVDVSFKQAEL
jgi:hypothetical protein